MTCVGDNVNKLIIVILSERCKTKMHLSMAGSSNFQIRFLQFQTLVVRAIIKAIFDMKKTRLPKMNVGIRRWTWKAGERIRDGRELKRRYAKKGRHG